MSDEYNVNNDYNMLDQETRDAFESIREGQTKEEKEANCSFYSIFLGITISIIFGIIILFVLTGVNGVHCV